MSPWKAWAGVAAAVVVLGLGIWQYRVYATSRAEAEVDTLQAAAPTVEAEPTPASPPTSPSAADSAGLAAADTLPDVEARGESLQVRVTGATGAAAGATPTGGTRPSRIDRYTGPWTRAVAQEWVNVRAAASRNAAVVGVVTPNTAVELGETRAGWRRVRTPGVEGWADARFFAADTVRR